MVKYFLFDDTGDHELESTIDSFNEKTYKYIKEKRSDRVKYPAQDESINIESISESSKSIKISKFTEYSDFHSIHFSAGNLLYVCKLTGYAEIWVNSIYYCDEFNNIVTLRDDDRKRLKLNDDLVVVKQKSCNLYLVRL